MVRPALALAVAAALLSFSTAAAAPGDTASIVNSGSTNAAGYTIAVSSDGSAAVTYQNREGPASPKPFTISPAQAAGFFADLKAARDGKAVAQPCMKSASFGTSTFVHWHGWTSPDLDCPPADKLTAAILHDVSSIRKAGNVTPALRRSFPAGPPRVIVSPVPTQ